MILLGAMVAAVGLTIAEPVLRLKYATFDPVAGEIAVPHALRAEAGSGVRIVQFRSSPGPAERAALMAAGARIMRFLPEHAYLVRGGVELETIPGVRWVGSYHPVYRLDPSILAGTGRDGPAQYSIECLERGPDAQRVVAGRIGALGGEVVLTVPDGFRLEAVLTADQVRAVARMDEVSFIDPTGPGGADMDIVREATGANLLEAATGFTGQGVRGEVFDTGLNTAHVSLQNPPPLIHGSAGTSLAHGTAVYGIIFADGTGAPQARGMLPGREQGIFSWYLDVFLGVITRHAHTAELVDPNGPYRAVFQSSSVGRPRTSAYTTVSAEMDDIILQFDLLMTQSSGDAGTPDNRPESWAKNILAVGSVAHQNTLIRADDVGGMSSGPAADGRVKPDLVNFADSILTICADQPTCLTTFGGSSAATPITAGCAGLVFQMWHEGVWTGRGGGASVFADRMHAATTRALLINRAYQYDWTLGGANATLTRARQGWGTADVGALYAVRGSTFIVDQEAVLTPGASAAYELDVSPATPALKATMVYADPPGSPAAALARVNDLSLRVISPGGTIYHGNHGLQDGIWSTPGGSPNDRDTVENVFIASPEAGTWRIEVTATELVMDARPKTPELDADFALVVSGVVLPGCYPDCNGDGVLNLADLGCFQTRFALGDPYADCNGDGNLNLADFGCYQTRFALGCP